VKADGSVARAAVVEAAPKEIFEENALKAVREWQFNPGRFHGEAVATWVVVPIQFRLTR
jgi:protein TonB